MLLSFTHSTTGISGAISEVTAISAVAKIYSPTQLFEELELKISALTVVSREAGVDGYISLTIPTSRLDIEEITTRIEGNVLLTINNINLLGDAYAIQSFDYAIDDFRYDLGAANATYTIILRGDFSTPPKQAITLINFSSKKKLTDQNAAVQRYIYMVNPNNYRFYSVGAAFTEGNISGVVTETTISTNGKSNNLTLEVEVG